MQLLACAAEVVLLPRKMCLVWYSDHCQMSLYLLYNHLDRLGEHILGVQQVGQWGQSDLCGSQWTIEQVR